MSVARRRFRRPPGSVSL